MNSKPADHLFRAFADENRLRLLNLMREGEICVCDLMSTLRMPQSKVSRHLAYLRRAGLVETRKDKFWSYYSLAKPAGAFHKRLLSCLAHCLDESPLLKKDLRSLKNRPLRERTCR